MEELPLHQGLMGFLHNGFLGVGLLHNGFLGVGLLHNSFLGVGLCADTITLHKDNA